MSSVTIKHKTFDYYMSEEEIQKVVKDVAERINKAYAGKTPLFIGVLNGAFMFAADLLKYIELECQISFLKVSSYDGMKSTEHIKQLIGFDIPVEGRDVIIVEDVIDTGCTMKYILDQMKSMSVNSVAVASFMFKPGAFKCDYKIDFVGKEIPDDFIVGYGFDLDGFGRNYRDIYKLKTSLSTFAISGAPGAGKGTQSQLLKDKYNIAYMSTGDALRAEIAKGTELGERIGKLINNGQFVPDELVLSMVMKFIKDAEVSGVQSILLDGFPRTLRQAEMLDEILEKEHLPFVGMIEIKVNESVLAERIRKRGEVSHRADDDVDTLKRRLDEYHRKTMPIMEYYKKQNKLFDVNGEGNILDINREICKVVDEII